MWLEFILRSAVRQALISGLVMCRNEKVQIEFKHHAIDTSWGLRYRYRFQMQM
jgi:hypothetical protein